MLLCPHSTAKGIKVRTSPPLRPERQFGAGASGRLLSSITPAALLCQTPNHNQMQKNRAQTLGLWKNGLLLPTSSHSAWALWKMLPRLISATRKARGWVGPARLLHPSKAR